jgi:transcriptional regulator with XRE-family HTH domain/GNAT superfamily N-acetyltransferase
MAHLDELIGSAVSLRPSATRGTGNTGKIRSAYPSDRGMICQWIEQWRIKSPNVTKWLGAESVRDLESQVDEWIGSDWGSYVLLNTDKESDSVPVAFINLHTIAGEIEVGRLVVNPAYERQGFGSSLLLHISRSINVDRHSKTTYARVLAANSRAQGMIRRLPFVETDAPLANSESDTNFFKFVGRTKKSRFGDALAKIRSSRELRQEEVGFLVGAAQSTIAYLESGKRSPSLETLSAICNGLKLSKGEKAQLLFSLIGEQVGKNTRQLIDAAYSTVESAKTQAQESLWIVSDRFLEEMSEEAIEISAESASKGYSRWYFAPPGFVESGSGASLVRRLLARASNPDVAKDSIRIYTAPAALCAMRFLVENPPRTLTADVFDARVSFGGNTDAERITFSGERAREFVVAMAKTIVRLPDDSVVDGFRLDIPTGRERI